MSPNNGVPDTNAVQSRVRRLRQALIGFGPFFATARHTDPLPALRDLACDLLYAESAEIVIPALDGPSAENPNQLTSPVIIGRRPIGRLEAQRSFPFDSDERAIGEALGHIIGAVLDQSALNSQYDQYRHQVQANADTLDQLLLFGRRVVSATAAPLELALQLATQVPAMVGGERASLLLTPPEKPDQPQLVLSNGNVSTVERARAVRDGGFAGLVLRERCPLIIDETDTDQRWLSLRLRDYNDATRCAMAVPLIWGPRLLGALTVTTTASHLFDIPQLNLLELVACHISLALHSANLGSHLEQVATTLGAMDASLGGALQDAQRSLQGLQHNHGNSGGANVGQLDDALRQIEAIKAQLAQMHKDILPIIDLSTP